MNMHLLRTFWITVAISAEVAGAEPLPGQDEAGWTESQQWKSYQKESRGRCAHQASFARLKRTPGRGNAVVAQHVDRILREQTPYAVPVDLSRLGDGDVLVQGENWLLEVEGDGRFVRFRAPGTSLAPVPVEERTDPATILARGEVLVSTMLSALVPLSAGERFMPVAASYHRQGFWPEGGVPYSEVLENIAVFTRTIDGVPVVGWGCRVVLFMDNDLNLTGFDLEWSSYKKDGAVLVPVASRDIELRLRALEQRGFLDASRRELSRTCGYIDSGVAAGSVTEYVQPGIVVQYQIGEEGFIHGTNVPLAEEFVVERQWPESVVLKGAEQQPGKGP